MIKSKTKPSDFRNFEMEAKYWLKKFGVFEWRIFIKHQDYPGKSEWSGWLSTAYSDRTATIGLAVDWGEDPVTDFEICRCAFHEVMELLLSDIRCVAEMDTAPTQIVELNKCVHSVIRTLENVIWKTDYLNRKGGKDAGSKKRRK